MLIIVCCSNADDDDEERVLGVEAKWLESGQTKSIVQFVDKRLLFHKFMISI